MNGISFVEPAKHGLGWALIYTGAMTLILHRHIALPRRSEQAAPGIGMIVVGYFLSGM